MTLKDVLKGAKLQENVIISVVRGLVLVAIVLVVLNIFFRNKGETIPPVEIGDEKTQLPTNHTVKKGEDLWVISEKYYGSGYNWVDIAKENKLNNPDLIVEGQDLNIPAVDKRVANNMQLTPTKSPEVSPTPTSAPSEGSKHKVAKGESLWQIAEKYFKSGYNWVDIAKANNLKNADVISEGTELTIPTVEAKKETLSPEVAGTSSIEGSNYEVQKGDNLWEIAVRAYGDGYKWTEIAKKNSLKNPNVIVSGTKLELPR